MYIRITNDTWSHGRGGRERYLFDLARGLSDLGHSVDTSTASGHRSLQHFLSSWRRRTPAFPGPILAGFPLSGATHVQLHSGLLETSLARERESLGPGLRNALFKLGNHLNRKRRTLLLLEREVLSGPSRPKLMVWSRSMAFELAARYNVPAACITVIAPAIRFPRPACPVFEKHAELRLLFVSQNFLLKGLRTTLRALQKALHMGLAGRLTVVGRDSQRPFLQLAQNLGISSSVDFLGGVSPEAMPRIYRDSDVLVHPTFNDSFSLAALEALSSGCPVLTTRRAGISEWIEEGVQGHILDDPRDVDGLAELLICLADPSRLARMKTAAWHMSHQFDFDSHVLKVLDWLSVP